MGIEGYEQETRQIAKLISTLERQPLTQTLIERANGAIKSLESARSESDFPKELGVMLERLKVVVRGKGLAA